jgi:hypothetical protein
MAKGQAAALMVQAARVVPMQAAAAEILMAEYMVVVQVAAVVERKGQFVSYGLEILAVSHRLVLPHLKIDIEK